MSRNESSRIREHYEESVAAVARMMDYVDSCYSFLDDDVYLQQVAAQISDPIGRYPTIRVTGLRSGKVEIRLPTSSKAKANGYNKDVDKESTAKADSEGHPSASQDIQEPGSVLRLAKAQARRERHYSGKTLPASAAGNRDNMSTPSVDSGVNSAKANTSTANLSSFVDDEKPTFRPNAAASSMRTSQAVSSKKPTTPHDVFASPLSEITFKPVPSRRASASDALPGTSLLKSSASPSTSLSGQGVPNVSVQPRPRRQASLRVNEFVRAEAELNGQRLDPHKMQRPPARGVVKVEPADVVDEVDGDYGIFGENANNNGADDDDIVKAEASSDEEDEPDFEASDDRQQNNVGHMSLGDLAPGGLFPQGVNEPTGYSCLYCDEVFVRAEAMETHIMDEHIYRSASSAPSEPNASSVAGVASSSFARSGGNPTWVQSPGGRHQTVRPPPGKTITIESLLSAHVGCTRKRSRLFRRQCLICKKTFTSWSQLKKHLPIHSSEKPHKCPYETCQYATVQKGNLKVHVLRVHVLREEKMAAMMDATEFRQGI